MQASRPASILRLAVAAFALVAPTTLAADLATAPDPDSCGLADCDLVQPDGQGLAAYPMSGQSLLELLRPHLDRDTYNLLDDLVGDALVPPEPPLPPRPTNASVEENVHIHEKIKLGKGKPTHVHAHAKARVNVSLVGSGETTNDTVVPCSDERGCPDLVVDASALAIGMVTQESFSADHCAVVEGSTEAGQRRLLRFTFTTPNVGDGDLIIGKVASHPEWFLWADCHGHFHFQEYADYRLWTPGGYVEWLDARGADPDATAQQTLERNPDLRDGFVAGHKQGFCVIDVRPYAPTHLARYNDCEWNQGISRGWADEYGFHLDGQWVDITDVPPGWYVLEAEVNAERFYEEIDYANNAGAILVAIPPS